MTTRLLLLSHSSTTALRHARFPLDERLDDDGVRRARAAELSTRWRSARVLCDGTRRTRETAVAMALDADAEITVEPRLSDLDVGRWSGASLDQLLAVEPAAVMAWMTDTSAVPHGGESIDGLVGRVGAWLESLVQPEASGNAPDGSGAAVVRTVAVSHPAVLRAALGHVLSAPAASFWSIDIEPLTQVRLQHTGGRWRFRAG